MSPDPRAVLGGVSLATVFSQRSDLIQASATDYGLEKNNLGKILGVSAAGWDSGYVESGAPAFNPITKTWQLFYTGYDATITHAGIGLAEAPSPFGPWTKYASNPILQGSGSGDDLDGCTGPVPYWENGTLYIFYIGLPTSGYEGGTKKLMLATCTDPKGVITRVGTLLSPSGSGWFKDQIYHISPTKWGGRYIGLINCKGDYNAVTGKERIGYASAPSLLGPWTLSATPILDLGAGGAWDSSNIGDPSFDRIGNTVLCWYYGTDGTHAQDGVAFCEASAFPAGPWTKSALNPLLAYDAKDNFINTHAHKPIVLRHGGELLHFYTAVGTAGRQIGLAASRSRRTSIDYPCPEQSSAANVTATSFASVALTTAILRPATDVLRGVQVRARVRCNQNGATAFVIRIKQLTAATVTINGGSSYKNYYTNWVDLDALIAAGTEAINLEAQVATGTGLFGGVVYEYRWY